MVPMFVRLRIKLGKMLAKMAPINRVRIFGLRLCGVTVGADVYVGEDLILVCTLSREGATQLSIGDRVSIGPRVTLILSAHPNASRLSRLIGTNSGAIRLGNDCWLGAGAIIHPGVSLAEGAVVGSGSVVTRSVERFTMVGGVPARAIKVLAEPDVLRPVNSVSTEEGEGDK